MNSNYRNGQKKEGTEKENASPFHNVHHIHLSPKNNKDFVS